MHTTPQQTVTVATSGSFSIPSASATSARPAPTTTAMMMTNTAASSSSMATVPSVYVRQAGPQLSSADNEAATLSMRSVGSGYLAGARMTSGSVGTPKMQTALTTSAEVTSEASSNFARKPSITPLWDRVQELCEAKRYLDAYKQVIAEPDETCLLRLMQHTGPIVEHLDAESNSRLIRRLIHILTTPAKEPVPGNIKQIYAWLWQALKTGVHFTASQVEDLATALHRVSSTPSPLQASDRTEAMQLLARVSALRK